MCEDKIDQSKENIQKLSTERDRLTTAVTRGYKEVDGRNERIEENKQMNPRMYDEDEDLLPVVEIEEQLHRTREENVRLEQEILKVYNQYIQDKQMFMRNVDKDCRGVPFKTFLDQFIQMKLKKIIPKEKIARLHLMKDIPLPDLMCVVDKGRSRNYVEYKILIGGRQYVMNKDGLFNIMEKLSEMEEEESETSQSASSMDIIDSTSIDSNRCPSKDLAVEQATSGQDDGSVIMSKQETETTNRQQKFNIDITESEYSMPQCVHDDTVRDTPRDRRSPDSMHFPVGTGPVLPAIKANKSATEIKKGVNHMSTNQKGKAQNMFIHTPQELSTNGLTVHGVMATRGVAVESHVVGQTKDKNSKLACQDYQIQNEAGSDKTGHTQTSNNKSKKVRGKRHNNTAEIISESNHASTDDNKQVNVQARKKSKKQTKNIGLESDNTVANELIPLREPHPPLRESCPPSRQPHNPHRGYVQLRKPLPPPTLPHNPPQRGELHPQQWEPHPPQKQPHPPKQCGDDGRIQETQSVNIQRLMGRKDRGRKHTLPNLVERDGQQDAEKKNEISIGSHKKEKKYQKYVIPLVDNHDYNRVSKPKTSSISRVPDVLPAISKGFLTAELESKQTVNREQWSPVHEKTPARKQTLDAKGHRELLRRQMKY